MIDLRCLEAPQSGVVEDEGSVYLNLEHEDDKGLYRNLIGDLVFVPRESSELVSLAKEWGKRARAIVVDLSKAELSRILKNELDSRVPIYSWDGENVTEPNKELD